MTDLDDALAELGDWLRIPSVSTAGGNPEALVEAAGWALRKIEAAGGSGELVQMDDTGHPPLVVGELRANRDGAPTILIYGHYDVQDPGDESRWTTPPFEPDIRDGRLYARGASDDKGNFLPLLLVACELADAGELAVNVRVLVEGEEETPADTAERWMAADDRGADAAIVFDSGMLDADTPALTVGTRGMVWADLVVTTGERPAHSGEFGGAALNAVHVLHRLLAAVLPDPGTGRPPEPLRAGLEAPSQAELDAWAQLPPGDRLLAEAGARPADARAGEELHVRTMAGTSVDVHRVSAGEPRTIVPERAEASLSVRLAGGQRSAEIAPALEALLRGALPEGAELELTPARRRAVALRPRGARAGRGAARARARDRRRPRGRPLRRVDPDPRRVRRAGHPDHRRRLRAPGGPHPRARRELPDRVAGAGPEGSARAVQELASLD